MSILDYLNFRALDANFNTIEILDSYDSAIWTERYNDVGDFELHGSDNPQMRTVMSKASYIFNTATSSLMIVEKPKTTYSEDEGSSITISGRAFESFLDRRVLVRNATIFDAVSPIKISQIICNLVINAFGVDPEMPGRHWADLDVYDNATSLTSPVLTPGVAMQFSLGENLLDVIIELCVTYGLGFKCRFSYEDKRMQFIVYEGVNRAIQGDGLVVFSELYDNLVGASDEAQFANVKNTLLVAGNKTDPVTNEIVLPIMIGDPVWTGLSRRETYVKVDQEPTFYISETEKVPMTNEEYVKALTLAGATELNTVAYQSYKNFEGAILETSQCQYGENFDLGDVVVFRTAPGQDTSARLDGVTFSDDAASGKTLAPSFVYGV